LSNGKSKTKTFIINKNMKNQQPEETTYQTAWTELQKIVNDLQGGSVGIDELTNKSSVPPNWCVFVAKDFALQRMLWGDWGSSSFTRHRFPPPPMAKASKSEGGGRFG
jgi:hypothetical protein